MKQYRGITIDGKDFVYGWYLENAHKQSFIVCTDISAPPIATTAVKSLTGSHDIVIIGAYEVIPETVGQFTGLKDRNGTEMYADDIVIIQREFGEYKEDLMFPTKCVAKLYGWHAEFEYGDNQAVDMALTYQNGREIIGNIHQSIELMKR